MVSKAMAIGTGVVVIAAATGAMYTASAIRDVRPAFRLLGDSYGQLRRQALAMYPRGTPVATVTDGLKTLGFRCAPARRLLPNINAPFIECDSAGRGYPTTGRIEVTVLARNGVMSDVEVGNGIDSLQADARTPDPQGLEPLPGSGKAEAEEGKGEKDRKAAPHQGG